MDATRDNLPEIEGSDKQVAWAEDLREQTAEALAEWREDMLALPPTFSGDRELYESLVKETIESILSHESASWWIDTMKGKLGSQAGINGIYCMPNRLAPVEYLSRRYEDEHGTPMHEEV